MKKFVALALLLCACPLLARGNDADAFSLQIKITGGERSKDSHSSTIVLTLAGQKLIYRTVYGGKLAGRAVAPREFKLTSEDQKKLIKLLKDKNLLVTETIEREQEASGIYRYFEVSVKAVVDGREGFIQIKGSRKDAALKEEKLYKDAVALVEAVYEIIHRADEDIVYEPLIH